jgi:hypothetical protein
MSVSRMGCLKPRGQGRMLPHFIDTKDPEAVRGTYQLRRIDANLTVGLDRRRHVYQVWGPSLSAGGWVPICDGPDDDGRPYRGTVPWELICHALIQARDGEPACDRAARENERREAELAARHGAEVTDALRFGRRAIAGERSGWGRWSGQEVAEAYARQAYGEKPGPTGRKIYIARG